MTEYIALLDLAEAALAVNNQWPKNRIPFNDNNRAMRDALDRLDAALIVELRNALPAMLRVIEAAARGLRANCNCIDLGNVGPPENRAGHAADCSVSLALDALAALR